MRLAVDLDNTLACYDAVFAKLVRSRNLLPAKDAASKTAIRDSLRLAGMEEAWTELQGWAYGREMAGAEPFPGAIDCLRQRVEGGDEIFLVSHRTRHPHLGPTCDLHKVARQWLDHNIGPGVFQNVYFEETRAEKLARIIDLRVHVWVDDLPEALAQLPIDSPIEAWHFDPLDVAIDTTRLRRFRSWQAICAALGSRSSGR